MLRPYGLKQALLALERRMQAFAMLVEMVAEPDLSSNRIKFCA
jgi:hypothetical protein